jgi:hypothetical protein
VGPPNYGRIVMSGKTESSLRRNRCFTYCVLTAVKGMSITSTQGKNDKAIRKFL